MSAPRDRRLRRLTPLVVAALLASALVAGQARQAPAAAALDQPTIDIANLSDVPESIWGVSDQNPADTMTPSLDVLVWDFAQIGDRMFVGGAFLNVRESENAPANAQPYVAAFDVNTGDWIDTWRPTLDRAVYALEVSPTGSLLVGGEFETVNGTTRRGLVALDPQTGAIDTRFHGAIDRPWTSLRAFIRDMEVIGNDLYVGGNFTHLDGPNGSRTQVFKAGRMDSRWGNFDASWKPVVAGSGIWGLSVDPILGYVYLAGYFTSVNNEPSTGYFHTISTATGSTVPGMIDIPRNIPPDGGSQPEMFDVTAVPGDKVFVVGEQHIVQVLDASDQDMLGYHHTGYSNNGFLWQGGFAGGAYQVSERIGDIVFAGCHCTFSERNGWVNHYSSYTGQRTRHRNIMAYSATSGALIESWLADINSPRDGAWAVASDTNGCVYIGGDFHLGGLDNNQNRWLGGFGKFCPNGFVPPDPPGPDTEAPTTPTNLSASEAGTDVVLDWDASTDNVGLQSYLIFRNGSYLDWAPGGATTYTHTAAPQGVPASYFVRAVDTSNNQSPDSSAVDITPGGEDTEPPSTPTGLTATENGTDVDLDWNQSTDNVGLQSYLIFRNGSYLDWAPGNITTYTHTNAPQGVPGTYFVRAVDVSNNQSANSDTVTISPGGADTEAPTAPTNLVASEAGPDVVLDWDGSTDNVGLQSYLIFRNGAYLGWVPGGTTTYTHTNAPAGVPASYFVRAIDTSNNQSPNSTAVQITPGGADTEAPSAPANLTAVANVDDVDLDWDASTDNVGLQSYLIFRNGAYHSWVPAGTTSYTDSGVPAGTYSYFVRAVDLSNNQSPNSNNATATVN